MPEVAIIKEITVKLAEIVGPNRVTDDDAACWAIMVGLSAEHPPISKLIVPPDIVIRPQSTEQVSQIVKLANVYKIPIVPAGGKGHPTAGALPTQGGILLDMLDMNRIVDIDEDSMIVTVEAGCFWESLRSTLAERGLRPGGLGPHGPVGAVGGGVATGTLPVDFTKYGFVSQEVEGLEVVLPLGDVIWTGSRANVHCNFAIRNVNGPDLTGVFCGSHGALGVITKVCLRIYPMPKWTLREAYAFNDYEKGLRAVREFQLTHYTSDTVCLVGQHTIAPFAPSAPPDTEIMVPILLEDGFDERLLKIKKEVCDKIAQKYGGKTLGSDAAWFVYDYFKQCHLPADSLGGPMEITGLKPTVYAAKDGKRLLEIPKTLESNFVLPFKNSTESEGMREWRGWFRALFASPHPNCLDDVLFMYFDGTDLDLGEEMLEEAHRIGDSEQDRGYAGYWIGHGKSEGMVKNWSQEYSGFVKLLKQTMDPNNIMNPGMFRIHY